MSIEALHAQLSSLDSSAQPALYTRLAIELASALAAQSRQPNGFDSNQRATSLLPALDYLVLRDRSPQTELAHRLAAFAIWSDCFAGHRDANLREALAHAERALTLLAAADPPQPASAASLLSDMAAAWLRTGDPDAPRQAAACCRRALDLLTPEANPPLHAHLTHQLAHTENATPGAIPDDETARRFEFAIHSALNASGPAAALPETWRMLHWAWSIHPEPNLPLVRAYAHLASLYSALGHHQESLPYIYCAIALATSPHDGAGEAAWEAEFHHIWRLLDQILVPLNLSHKAVDLSTSARGGFASALEAWQLGNQLLTRNPSQALLAYEQALTQFPLWPAGLHARGLAHLLLDNPTAAIDDFNASLQFLPNHPKTLFARSKAHTRLGSHDLAAADLAQARALDPNIPAAASTGA